MVRCKQRELLESPESRQHHNVTGNSKRDGLKRCRIGQSAAKRPSDRLKVQRSGYTDFANEDIIESLIIREADEIPRARCNQEV